MSNTGIQKDGKVHGFERKVKGYGQLGYTIKDSMGNGILGSYDGLTLRTSCSNGWQKAPCNVPGPGSYQWVPNGTPLPLKDEMIYQRVPQDSMFIFANSRASLDCCPSTYSTDRGCICPNDVNPLNKRGNNKTYENYNF